MPGNYTHLIKHLMDECNHQKVFTAQFHCHSFNWAFWTNVSISSEDTKTTVANFMYILNIHGFVQKKTYMVHAILSEYIVRRPMYAGRPFIPLGHSSHMTEHNCCVNVIGFCLAWYLFCYPRHHPSWVPLTMAQGIVHHCENYISCSKRRRGRRRKIVM